MNLLQNFLILINCWWLKIFGSHKTAGRAQVHALGALCGQAPHTLTSIITFKGTEDQDWSSDYKLYSRAKWSIEDIFGPNIKATQPYFNGPYIYGAVDDSVFKKTGKKIKTASWQRDPMSPPFHTNLIYGIRFLQISLTLPLYEFDSKISSRAIPVDFTEVPVFKKPKKKASKEEWNAYNKEVKTHRIPSEFIKSIREFRKHLDKQGFEEKTLIISADNAFCNRYGLEGSLDRIIRVMRCRKDIKLCQKSLKKRSFYSEKTFTPEEIYKNDNIPWLEAKIFRVGKYRKVFYKEIHGCFWRSSTKRKPFTMIVLKRTPYRLRKGRICYRCPAFLLCEESEIETIHLIQAYHDHPGIELNFKEEKQVVGVGEAQVRNKKSVARQPALVVAAYSSLLLAGIAAYQDKIIPQVAHLPSWRKDATRPSIRMLIKELKKELLADPNLIHELHLSTEEIEMMLKIAA